MPHLAEHVDDIALIRSMHTSHSNHYNATLGMHTGSFTFARPSIGSWVSYGLGTMNRNLPSFVVIAPQSPYAGGQVWGSDFLPGSHQGTLVVPGPEPVANIQRRAPTSRLQELELGMLSQMNERHLASRSADPLLAARIKSFQTAFGMQAEMPEVFDLSKETDATLKLYGLERGSTQGFAWQCLVARRLAERGVRFVELIDVGSSGNWDAHGDMLTHAPLAKNIDQATAGLVDPVHGPFVHSNWWWRSSKKQLEKAKAYEPKGNGFIMSPHKPSKNSRAYAILGGQPITEIGFYLPGVAPRSFSNGETVDLKVNKLR